MRYRDSDLRGVPVTTPSGRKLGTLAGFSRLVHAVDRAAPDAGPGIAAAIDGARRVTERLAARLQANLERLAVLDEIGAGRRT